MNLRYPLLFCTVLLATALTRAQCPVTVDAGEDVYLCAPDNSAQLNASIDGDYLSFVWAPISGMSGANTLSPSVTVFQTTTYTLTARAADLTNNLIFNGDFEQGNTGFYSDYLYNPGDLVPEGVYDVLPNPQASHPGFSPCEDHTSGAGNMMAVNGAGVPNQNVWCQTVAVQPNTQYVFSAWVTSLVAASPALLQFSINGNPIGPIFNAPSQTCVWQNFYTEWNSGANGIATICVVNQNTTLGGNDFALDDIVFSPTCQVADSVTVHRINLTAVASPPLSTIPCSGSPITLSGAGSSAGPDITYLWETPNGNIVSGENTLNPVVDEAGTYTLNVIYNNGSVECIRTASVSVIENPNPLIAWITPAGQLGCGNPTLTLIGNSSQPGFSQYTWTTQDGNIVSGANTKNCVVDASGIYHLLVTNSNTGCTAEAEISVIAATDPPVANAQVLDTLLSNCTLHLSLSGQNSLSGTGNALSFAWTAFNGGNLSGPANQALSSADTSGLYVLTVTDTGNGCTHTDTVEVAINLSAPAITILPPDSFNCKVDTIQLTAQVVSTHGAQYLWTPLTGGLIAGEDTSLNLTVLSPGQYLLTATDTVLNCVSRDTAWVSVDTLAPIAQILTPDTLTCIQPEVVLSGDSSSIGPDYTYWWFAENGGNITQGDSTLHPTVNSAGNYFLIVTDTLNFCKDTASVQVIADTSAVTAIANAPDTISCQNPNVLLNANGSSSGPSIAYLWTTTSGNIVSGANTPTPLVAAAGSYQLLITNLDNGCSATDLAIARENFDTPNLNILIPDTLNCNLTTQTIQGQNNAPGGPHLYQWTASGSGNILSGANTLTPQIDQPGAYTLIATNATSGCQDTASTLVWQDIAHPTADVTTPDTLSCQSPVINLDGSGSTAGPEFQYQWTATNGGNILSGANTLTPQIDQPGLYLLTVSNTRNGCTASDSASVFSTFAPPPANAGIEGLLTCYQTVFLLTANAGLQQTGLDFEWTTLSGGNLISPPDSFQVGCDAPGLYRVLVTDPATGCTASDTVAVVSNQVPPQIQPLLPDTLTCQNTILSINPSVSANSANLAFAWSTFGGNILSDTSSQSVSVGTPGIYIVTVTDMDNGCTAGASFPVARDTVSPGLQLSPPDVLTCSQQQVALNGAASIPVAAQWTTNAGQFITGADSLEALVDQPGWYVLTVTDPNNGCRTTDSILVDQQITPPVVSIMPPDTLDCIAGSLVLNGNATGTGSLNYAWSAQAGANILAGADTPNPVIDQPGTYELVVTDAFNGCSASAFVTVSQNTNAPVANAGLPDTLTCTVTQLSLQGSGSTGPGFQYLWQASSGGNIVSGAGTLSPQINAPGLYTLQITSLLNGCTATDQVTISLDTLHPLADAGHPDTLTCLADSLYLEGGGSAGVQYFWQTTNGNILSGADTPMPLVNQPGAYLLTVTHPQNGCTAVAQTFVQQDTLAPQIGVDPPATLTCVTLEVALNGAVTNPHAAYQSVWETSNGNIVSGAQTLNCLVNAPGAYRLVVAYEQNGCTAEVTVLVPRDTTPPLAMAGADVSLTCAMPFASLSGAGSSAGAAFSYLWTTDPTGNITSGDTTLTPQVGAPGAYQLLVTNLANGCTAVDWTTVTEDKTPPSVGIAPPLPLTCVRDSVALDASASNTGPNLLAAWTTSDGQILSGQADFLAFANRPGTYQLVVSNLQNGCSAVDTVAVLSDTLPPGADAGPGGALHCNQPTLMLTGSSPYTGPVSYNWSTTNGEIVGNTQSAVITAAREGRYLLEVIQPANGCRSTDSVTVVFSPPPAFTLQIEQPNCKQPGGNILIDQVAGGLMPYQYSANNGASFSDNAAFSGLPPGAYQVVVKDAYGCTAVQQADIPEPFEPEVYLPDFQFVPFGDSVLLQPETNIPGGQVASWMWSPSYGLSCTDCETPFAQPFRFTTYTLTVVDQNGCPATTRMDVHVDRARDIYAPNIFSPDGDGLNDRFTLFGRGIQEIQSLQVYDRWGNLVFEGRGISANDELAGWDGTSRGQEAAVAVYVWQAVVIFIDGEEKVFAGDVTLFR